MLGSWPNCSHGLTQPLALFRKPMDMRHTWTCAWCTLHARGFFHALFVCPCCRRCHDRKLKVGSPPHAPTPPPLAPCPIVTIVEHDRTRKHDTSPCTCACTSRRVVACGQCTCACLVVCLRHWRCLSTNRNPVHVDVTSTSTWTQIRTPVPKNSYITCKSHYHLHHTILLCGCCSQS